MKVDISVFTMMLSIGLAWSTLSQEIHLYVSMAVHHTRCYKKLSIWIISPPSIFCHTYLL